MKDFENPFSRKDFEILERTYKKFATLEIDDKKWQQLKSLEEPINGRIVECTKDQETGAWKFLRFRDDKLNGNHTSVVQKVLESISDSVKIEDLAEVAADIKELWEERVQEEKSSGSHTFEAPQSQNRISTSNGVNDRSQVTEPSLQPTYVDEEDFSD